MNHGYRYLSPVLLVALASACSEEDDAGSARDPNVAASAGSAGTSASSGSAGTSSSAPSSAAAAGSSGADRASGGTSLGNNAGPAGSQGSRGGGRFRDRDPQDLDAGAQDAGDVVLDAGDAGVADGGAPANFSFFVTSEGSSASGGNLGGLAGADALCELLASRVGAGDRTWRAYLSTSDVNAGDRIGAGPWFNRNGDPVAADLTELHTVGISNADPQNIIDENGAPVPANQHDILTGSLADGTLAAGATCQDWTSSGDAAQNPLNVAQVGHSDRANAALVSWNSAHSVNGCSEAALVATGGAGRLYCFAAD